MAAPSVTYTFSNGTTADATEVNQNFTDIIDGITDGTEDLTIRQLVCQGATTFNSTINKVTITAPTTSATITVADGKTFTCSNTLTFSGTDSSSVAFGAGGTVTYTSNTLAVFSATTSSQLAGVISDETGSGSLVFGTSPRLTLPYINDLSSDHYYIITTPELTGNRVLNLPLLTTTDTVVCADFAQTLASKTLSSPTISGTVTMSSTPTLSGSFNITGSISTITGSITSSTGNFIASAGNFQSTSTGNIIHLDLDSADTNVTGNVMSAFDFSVDTTPSGGSHKFASFRLGGVEVGYIYADSTTTTAYATSSDSRLKTNVALINDALGTVEKIRPVSYDYKKGGASSMGFIAQELHKVYPLAVCEGDDNPDEIEKMWAVDYSKLTPILTKAIQELSEKVKLLESELSALKGENG